MKHHYNKEELIELKRKYDMQVSKEAIEEIKHTIDLDKEIERLTQSVTLLTNKLIDMTKEKEKYKSRNDKAIELIKMYDGKPVLRDYYDRDLLNILQGSDKEC